MKKSQKIILFLVVPLILFIVVFNTADNLQYTSDVDALKSNDPVFNYKQTICSYETDKAEIILYTSEANDCCRAIFKKRKLFGKEYYDYKSAMTFAPTYSKQYSKINKNSFIFI